MTKPTVPHSIIWASELTSQEFERAARGMTEKRFDKGSYLCHRGDRMDHWTGIITGLVKMSSVSRDGKPITFAGIGAGGWFGEGTVLKGEARQYDLVALRETHLLFMNRATFLWLYDNSPGFNRFLVRQLNERLGQFIAVTESDRSLAPEARVGRHLSWLCNPILSPHAQGKIEITQEELALLAGVSRPVVGRALRALQAAGLITLGHSEVRVHDVEKLASFSN